MTLTDRLNLIATVAASLSFRGKDARCGNNETIYMLATLPDEAFERVLNMSKMDDPEAVAEMDARKDSLIEALKPCPTCGQERQPKILWVDQKPRVWGACPNLCNFT